MDTHFSAAQLARPGIAEASAILKTCQHYGFCTAGCPTYQLLGDENDGPRGRIDLIKAMLESEAAPAPKTVLHLDRCLSCMSCMTTCAVQVDYMHLIDRARAHIEARFRRPVVERLLRALIARTIPDPRAFRAGLAAARRLRGLARWLPRRLAKAMQPLLDMTPDSLPPAAGDVRPGTHPALGERKLRVALLAGCAQRVLAPEINAASLRLLARAGCEVVVAAKAGCCGSLSLHMGREREAQAFARRNVDAWIEELETRGLDAIVVNASGCGSTVKDYGHLLGRDPAYRDQAARVAALARDLSECLVSAGLAPPAQPRRYALAYHDACSMRNVQKVTEAPRRLLREAGYLVREVPEAHFCCGSAGTYNLLQPELAAALGRRKAGHIASTGAAMVAAGNIGCLVQLRQYARLPAAHTAELLDWAHGGPAPAAFAGRVLEEAPPEGAPQAGAPGELGIW